MQLGRRCIKRQELKTLSLRNTTRHKISCRSSIGQAQIIKVYLKAKILHLGFLQISIFLNQSTRHKQKQKQKKKKEVYLRASHYTLQSTTMQQLIKLIWFTLCVSVANQTLKHKQQPYAELFLLSFCSAFMTNHFSLIYIQKVEKKRKKATFYMTERLKFCKDNVSSL